MMLLSTRKTSFFPASVKEASEVVETLIAGGADPNQANIRGASPLLIAVQGIDFLMARVLCENGAKDSVHQEGTYLSAKNTSPAKLALERGYDRILSAMDEPVPARDPAVIETAVFELKGRLADAQNEDQSIAAYRQLGEDLRGFGFDTTLTALAETLFGKKELPSFEDKKVAFKGLLQAGVFDRHEMNRIIDFLSAYKSVESLLLWHNDTAPKSVLSADDEVNDAGMRP